MLQNSFLVQKSLPCQSGSNIELFSWSNFKDSKFFGGNFWSFLTKIHQYIIDLISVKNSTVCISVVQVKFNRFLALKIDSENWNTQVLMALNQKLLLIRYQKIFPGCSFGCKSLLNFTCTTITFHDCHQASVHDETGRSNPTVEK